MTSKAKSMFKGERLLVLAGIILGAFGLVLINFDGSYDKTAAVDQYSSTWKATKLYRLHFATNNNATIYDLGAIGVRTWEVTGTVSGTTFREKWEGPSSDTITFSSENVSGGVSQCRVNADPKIWLGSCLHLPQLGDDLFNKYWLTDIDPASVVNQGNILKNSWSGSSARCGTNTLPGCWSSTGSYGFARFTSKVNNDNGQTQAVGVMMPLQWTVTGEID